MPGKRTRDPIPESFASIEEAAEFWDSPNTADYDDLMHEVHFDADIQLQCKAETRRPGARPDAGLSKFQKSCSTFPLRDQGAGIGETPDVEH